MAISGSTTPQTSKYALATKAAHRSSLSASNPPKQRLSRWRRRTSSKRKSTSTRRRLKEEPFKVDVSIGYLESWKPTIMASKMN
jgi:hypothetical protein